MFGWISSTASAVGDWASKNRNSIYAGLAGVAAATVVAVALPALLPAAASAVGVAMLVGGVAGLVGSGVSYCTKQWLDDKPIDGLELARQCSIGLALGIFTGGLGKYCLPAARAGVAPAVTRIAARAGLSPQGEKMLLEGAAKGTIEAAIAGDAQVAKNLFETANGTKPLSECCDGVAQATGKAFAWNGATGAMSPITDPLKDAAKDKAKAAWPGVKDAAIDQAKRMAPIAGTLGTAAVVLPVVVPCVAPVTTATPGRASTPSPANSDPASAPSPAHAEPQAPCEGLAQALAGASEQPSSKQPSSEQPSSDPAGPANATAQGEPTPASETPARKSLHAQTVENAGLGD